MNGQAKGKRSRARESTHSTIQRTWTDQQHDHCNSAESYCQRIRWTFQVAGVIETSGSLRTKYSTSTDDRTKHWNRRRTGYACCTSKECKQYAWHGDENALYYVTSTISHTNGTTGTTEPFIRSTGLSTPEPKTQLEMNTRQHRDDSHVPSKHYVTLIHGTTNLNLSGCDC